MNGQIFIRMPALDTGSQHVVLEKAPLCAIIKSPLFTTLELPVPSIGTPTRGKPPLCAERCLHPNGCATTAGHTSQGLPSAAPPSYPVSCHFIGETGATFTSPLHLPGLTNHQSPITNRRSRLGTANAYAVVWKAIDAFRTPTGTL